MSEWRESETAATLRDYLNNLPTGVNLDPVQPPPGLREHVLEHALPSVYWAA
jgi:hypothetical protein